MVSLILFWMICYLSMFAIRYTWAEAYCRYDFFTYPMTFFKALLIFIIAPCSLLVLVFDLLLCKLRQSIEFDDLYESSIIFNNLIEYAIKYEIDIPQEWLEHPTNENIYKLYVWSDNLEFFIEDIIIKCLCLNLLNMSYKNRLLITT